MNTNDTQVYVRRNKTRPAVLSMSVEGYQSTLMDDMVDRLVRDNVAVVVSAGNTQVSSIYIFSFLYMPATFVSPFNWN